MVTISFKRIFFSSAIASVALVGVAAGAAAPSFANDSLPVVRPTAAHVVRAATERLLGSDSATEEAQASACLPFTREISVGGFISGSLGESLSSVGMPAAPMVEAWRAFATSLDLERDLRDGDRFHVRYEQKFTGDGHPIGVGRVLWAELRSAAKGAVAIHRFHTKDQGERFWSSAGQLAGQPAIRVPLDTVKITSGFGMRPDPFDKVMGTASAVGPLPDPTAAEKAAAKTEAPTPAPVEEEAKPVRRAVRGGMGFSGFGGSSLGGARDLFDGGRAADHEKFIAAREARERAAAESETAAAAKETEQQQAKAAPAPAKPVARLFMHEGVDLLANAGTPVYAAADGIVLGATSNGRYGNWIQVDHAGKLSTVYGHLQGFAPGIEAGTRVSQGELIGFVGNTGRSTGAHLHFEILTAGRPVDPLARSEMSRAQLRGADLERFRKQIKVSLAERENEMASVRSQHVGQ